MRLTPLRAAAASLAICCIEADDVVADASVAHGANGYRYAYGPAGYGPAGGVPAGNVIAMDGRDEVGSDAGSSTAFASPEYGAATVPPLASARSSLHDSPTLDDMAADRDASFLYHKALLPLDFVDCFTMLFAAAGLIIAAGGGIGGGGILVPSYMIFLSFRPKHAIALSNFTILGGAISNVMSNVRKRRPDGRPLIDWDIIVMMEPSTIAGALVGGFVSKYLPDFVLTVPSLLHLCEYIGYCEDHNVCTRGEKKKPGLSRPPSG